MGRVLSISSQTVFGPVGNSAAVPALQERGHEVLALPTILLSNHPGHGKPSVVVTAAETLQHMCASLETIKAFDNLDAVLTGYFANAAQVVAVAEQIRRLRAENKQLHVLVDPVLGDHGRLYVPLEVAESIREQLLPLATITTPNRFELDWLTGEEKVDAAVARLGVAECIVTSLPCGDGRLATRLVAPHVTREHVSPHLDKVPNGTGDFLAGAYLARRLEQEPSDAFDGAMARLKTVIAKSAGSTVLHLA